MQFKRMLDDCGNTTFTLTDATAIPELHEWIARPVGWGEAPCFGGATAREAVQRLNAHYHTDAVPHDQATADLYAAAEPLTRTA